MNRIIYHRGGEMARAFERSKHGIISGKHVHQGFLFRLCFAENVLFLVDKPLFALQAVGDRFDNISIPSRELSPCFQLRQQYVPSFIAFASECLCATQGAK